MRRPKLLNDPRRPGKLLALVWCWCGRVYTLTPEESDRHHRDRTSPCPGPVHHLMVRRPGPLSVLAS